MIKFGYKNKGNRTKQIKYKLDTKEKFIREGIYESEVKLVRFDGKGK